MPAALSHFFKHLATAAANSTKESHSCKAWLGKLLVSQGHNRWLEGKARLVAFVLYEVSAVAASSKVFGCKINLPSCN